MKKRILLGLCACLLVGCATTSQTEQRYSDEFASLPEYQEIDSELNQLDLDTKALDEEYTQIQKIVLERMQFTQNPAINNGETTIYINKDNIILVNNQVMSRNDFQLYVDKKQEQICHPTPKLAIHPNADYDAAAWVLETVYTAGCFDVSIMNEEK